MIEIIWEVYWPHVSVMAMRVTDKSIGVKWSCGSGFSIVILPVGAFPNSRRETLERSAESWYRGDSRHQATA